MLGEIILILIVFIPILVFSGLATWWAHEFDLTTEQWLEREKRRRKKREKR